MSLSHEEITNTVQQLVGPGFKVKLSWNQLNYLSTLKGQYLELGLLQAALGHLVMMGASQGTIAMWQQRVNMLSSEIEKIEKKKSLVAKCSKCKNGWCIDYNGVSKYPCDCELGKFKALKSVQDDVNFKGIYTESKNNVVAIDTINKFYPNKLEISSWQSLQGDTNGNLQTERKNTRKNTLPPVTGRKFRE
jgi:hypothetical protein